MGFWKIVSYVGAAIVAVVAFLSDLDQARQTASRLASSAWAWLWDELSIPVPLWVLLLVGTLFLSFLLLVHIWGKSQDEVTEENKLRQAADKAAIEELTKANTNLKEKLEASEESEKRKNERIAALLKQNQEVQEKLDHMVATEAARGSEVSLTNEELNVLSVLAHADQSMDAEELVDAAKLTSRAVKFALAMLHKRSLVSEVEDPDYPDRIFFELTQEGTIYDFKHNLDGRPHEDE